MDHCQPGAALARRLSQLPIGPAKPKGGPGRWRGAVGSQRGRRLVFARPGPRPPRRSIPPGRTLSWPRSSRSTPALADGAIFIRSDRRLLCFRHGPPDERW